jgi:hypothetical protein
MDKIPEWMLAPAQERPRGRWRRLMDHIGPAAIRDRIAYRYVRTTKVVSGIAAAVVLFGAAALFWAGYSIMNRAEPTPPGAQQTEALSGLDAFARTPAERFAVGAAGIQVPRAAPAGPFTANQVAAALAQVKQALMTARLDSPMLLEHDPGAYLELLRPSTRTTRQADFGSSRYATYATQLADGVQLAKQSPRVKGTMTYRVASTQPVRVLEVTTNYVWAYPVAVEGGEPTAVVVHDRQVWHRVHPDDEPATATGTRHISLVKADAAVHQVDCAELKSSGRLAPEPVGQFSADDRRFFDPGQPVRAGLTC